MLALCFFSFSYSLFHANSSMILGPAKGSLSLLPFVAVVSWAVFWATRSPIWRPGESPTQLLLLALSSGMVFLTLSLWEALLDETRERENRKWIAVGIIGSTLSVILATATIIAWTQTFTKGFTNRHIKELTVAGSSMFPIVAVVPQFPDGNFVFVLENPNPGKPVLKFSKATPDKRLEVIYIERLGQSFVKLGEDSLAYFSEKPIWGQEIRVVNINDQHAQRIWPKGYWPSKSLRAPFASPDGKRIAYLGTTSMMFGRGFLTSVQFTKYFYYWPTDYITLTSHPNVTFDPIGWTPDGYDFMLRKTGPAGPEIWAVDWVASGARRFLTEFSDAIITENDLPQVGEWISLIQKDAEGKWTLCLVNYRSEGKVAVGNFENAPLRAWTKSGKRFACWSAENGLAVYNVSDTIVQHADCSAIPPVQQMKWSPGEIKLAIVTRESGTPESASRLEVLDVDGCNVTNLVGDFAANAKQWDWLSDEAIVYARGGELWQVDTNAEQTLVLSTAVFHR
jgi:hypothetical protein